MMLLKNLWMVLLLLLAGVASAEPAKNVIVLIGDGMGDGHIAAGRSYLGRNLRFEDFPYKGRVQTGCADAQVTDSAAAGTAIFTGHKVNVYTVSLANPPDAGFTVGQPYETLAEYMKARGKSVGSITTCHFNDATPAAFAAHESHRSSTDAISDDIFGQTQPNLVWGGASGLSPTSTKLLNNGYSAVTTRDQLLALPTTNANLRSCALFGAVYMNYEYDGMGTQPHLSDMATKALQILENNTNGFVLMIEGGKIDLAAHGNDGPRVTAEVVEFDRTVGAVLDWAQGTSVATPVVRVGDTWRYHDAGTDPGAGWAATGFSDSAWKTGATMFAANEDVSVGYATALNPTTTVGKAYYFRKTVELPAPGDIRQATLRVQMDDGAAAYWNGTELWRANLPTGVLTSTTEASISPDENVWFTINVPTNQLLATNVLAIEVHHAVSGSMDSRMNATLEVSSGGAMRNDTLIVVAADHETGGITNVVSQGAGVYPAVQFTTGGHTAWTIPCFAWGAGASAITNVQHLTNIYQVCIGAAPVYGGGTNDIVVEPPAILTEWTAYNDMSWYSGQPLFRITSMGVTGTGGKLVDYVTGSNSPSEVFFSGAEMGLTTNGAIPPAGSDADAMFGGIVSPNGYRYWGTGTVSMAFTGLDTERRYQFALYGSRGVSNASYASRWNDVRISGSQGFVNRSSSEALITTQVQPDDCTRVTAANITGQIVRYDDIQPGPDGDFVIQVTAGGSSSTSAYVNAFMLRVQPAFADGNGNGLPDDWEVQYFGSTNDPAGAPEGDFDNDGFPNRSEWRAGTDPASAGSRLEVQALAGLPADTGSVVMQWPSASNKTYAILSTTNLTTGWTTLAGGIPARPPLNTHTVSVYHADLFLRIKVE